MIRTHHLGRAWSVPLWVCQACREWSGSLVSFTETVGCEVGIIEFLTVSQVFLLPKNTFDFTLIVCTNSTHIYDLMEMIYLRYISDWICWFLAVVDLLDKSTPSRRTVGFWERSSKEKPMGIGEFQQDV